MNRQIMLTTVLLASADLPVRKDAVSAVADLILNDLGCKTYKDALTLLKVTRESCVGLPQRCEEFADQVAEKLVSLAVDQPVPKFQDRHRFDPDGDYVFDANLFREFAKSTSDEFFISAKIAEIGDGAPVVVKSDRHGMCGLMVVQPMYCRRIS